MQSKLRLLVMTVSVVLFSFVSGSAFGQSSQTRVPDSDISAGNWSTSPLWSKVNSVDGSFISHPANSNTSAEVGIQDASYAGTYTEITVSFRAKKSATGGATRGLDANLKINGIYETSKTAVSDLSNSFTTYSATWSGLTLTQTDINSLVVQFTATGTTSSGGNARTIDIDYIEVTLTYTACSAISASISGTSSNCSGNSTNLSVNITGGATPYTVVYSDGSNNHTVNSYTSGSNISVSPSATTTYSLVSVTDANGCEASSLSGSAVVTVNNAPATPGAITGETSVCVETANLTYSVPAVNGATSYNWSVPSGWTITSTPPYTNSIEVTAGTAGGNISVSASNECGSSTASLLPVSVNAKPQVAANGFASATGNTSICNGEDGQVVLTMTAASVGPFSVVYNNGTNDITATGVQSGVAFNVSPSPTSQTTYTLVSITDANGCVRTEDFTDATAQINVRQLPTATISVDATSACMDGTSPVVTFTETNTATTATPYTFTYKINGGEEQTITGVSGSSATLSVPTTAEGEFTYTLVSVGYANSTACTNSASGEVTVTVLSKPSITTQPISQSVTYGDNAVFTAAGSGDGATFQWQISNGVDSWVDLTDGSQYSGGTTSELTVIKPAVSMSGNIYRVVVSGSCEPAAESDAASLSVEPKQLTPHITANDKPYDGSTTATLSAQSVSGYVSGEAVTLEVVAANFDTKNIGTDKTVTATGLTLGGADAGNYVLEDGATATDLADITQRDLNVSATGVDKVFDENTTATVNLSSDKVSGDVVNISYATADFDSPDVGANKTVLVTGISISGADAPNYHLVNTTAETTANITLAASSIVSVTASPNPVQYSDPVTFTAIITSPTAQLELNNTGGTVEFRLKPVSGSAVMLGSSGADDWSVVDGKVVVTKQFVITQAPRTYTIEATFTPISGNIDQSTDNNAGSLEISRENARVVYTGDIIKGVQSNQSMDVVFDLRATIYDISFPAYAGDNYPGDIRSAKVKFVDRDNGNSLIGTGNLTPVLVDGVNTMVGSVTGDITLTIPSTGFITKNIGIVVEGYYTRDNDDDNVMLTAYLATGDFITGGGYIVPDKPTGTYSSEPGKKVNFGYNVKFNKNGKALQGNMNIIYRKMVNGVLTNVQIKNNSMYSLGVNATNMTAEFISKVSVKNLTTGEPISDANWLYVKMEDNTGKGKPDRISFTLVTSQNQSTPADPTILANIVWSSNWVDLRTDLLDLGGGNLVVHSGFNVGSATASTQSTKLHLPSQTQEQKPVTMFNLSAFPNPTKSEFNVKLESSNTTEEISLVVYGINGQVVEKRQHLVAGQTIQLGAQYRPGMYLVEMIQGDQRKQVKLLKQPD